MIFGTHAIRVLEFVRKHVIVLALLLPGCSTLDKAAQHIPPGKYEIDFSYGDDKGDTYGGGISYTKESETVSGAILSRDKFDGSAPKRIRVRRSDVAAVGS